jgi:hypothetical protein
MSEVRKFSLLYDMEQDRIAWDLEHMNGDTTRLWLTQRLGRRLIDAILPIVQKAAAKTVPAQHLETINSFEQAAAMANFGNVPGVRATPSSRAALITSVDLTPNEQGLVLTFHAGGQTQALGLAPAQLRQTLSVIYKLHEGAGWPTDFWPAWIADPTSPGAAAAGVVN